MSAPTLRAQLRAMALENLGLKIISLFCALGLFAFIHGAGGDAQRTFSVGVVVIRPPDSANRELLTQPPTEIGITVRGPRSQLDDLRPETLGSLRLDLRSGRDTRVDLDASMFSIPAGLTVEQIIPQAIQLKWDDVIERPLPIQVARTGEPAPGLAVKGPIQTEPATVIAHGPRTSLDVMQIARTAPFDVSGMAEGTYRRTLPLDKPPSYVSFDNETIVAVAEIVRELKTAKFKLKVEVVGVPRATTSPSNVTVTVIGTPEDVNGLLPEAIVPRVEPRSAGADITKPSSAVLDVLVDVPRVKVEIEPKQVLVKW